MPESSQRMLAPIRVLYQQFVFRIVELDALSSKADVAKLLGQLASVLLMFSLILMLAGFGFGDVRMSPPLRQVAYWTIEYRMLSLTFLTVGLCTILGWDALSPDRKDAFVLGPLPVQPRVLCIAKTSASCSVALLSALVLNCASGLIWPVVLSTGGLVSIVRSFVAYWLTLAFAAIFFFAGILAIQSAAALFLPRSLFLRASTALQVLLFAILLASFFLEPAALAPGRLTLQSTSACAPWFPPYCFTAMFFEMEGALPSGVSFAAYHGWILLAGAVMVAAVCSTALYATLLPRIIATADTTNTRFGLKRLPFFDRSVLGPLLLFTGRSLLRNRQQKLLMAFYLGVGSAILFAVLDITGAQRSYAVASSSMSSQYLASTMVMMTAVVIGLRIGFRLPVSLQANWVFGLHQVQTASEYLNATRFALIILAVAPVCLVSAIFGPSFGPITSCCEHLALLSLYGVLLVDISLYGNRSIPYTCSYLPGSVQLPFLFWGSVIVFIPVVDALAREEQRILESALGTLAAFFILSVAVCILEWLNRTFSASVELRFDDVPEETVVTLGLNAA